MSRSIRNSRRSARAREINAMRFTEVLSAWFDQNARKLPWRTARRSPYATLVSEIMLQQTQVVRVVEKYRTFMKAFPSFTALARASEQTVLAHWQGLGYYRRAQNLHQAAKVIHREHRGRVPADVADLVRLPGVGRYTAGAIASIAFSRPAPIVDGNMQRVLTRVWASTSPALKRDPHSWAWEKSQELVAVARRPGAFNEAMMELGATICLPSPAAPRCGECPLARCCATARNGHSRPKRSKTKVRKPVEHHHAVIVHSPERDSILLEQRPARGMWSSMWQVPTIESRKRLAPTALRQHLPRTIRGLKSLGRFVHETSHRRLIFHVFSARSTPNDNGQWKNRKPSSHLPMSNAQRRVLEFLDDGSAY